MSGELHVRFAGAFSIGAAAYDDDTRNSKVVEVTVPCPALNHVAAGARHGQNEEQEDDDEDDEWDTLLLQVMSLSDPPLEQVALLDRRGVLVTSLAELRDAVRLPVLAQTLDAGQHSQSAAHGLTGCFVYAVEGVGLLSFDAGAVWRTACSFRLLSTPAEVAAEVSRAQTEGQGPLHAPTLPFSAPVGTGTGQSAQEELEVFPASSGAAHQPAFVVDLGPGPDPKVPSKKRPFALVCQACAEMCFAPGKAVPAPSASGSHLRFRCMTATLAALGRIAGAGLDTFEGLQPEWQQSASASAICGAIRRCLLRAGTTMSDGSAFSDRAPEVLSQFWSRLRGGMQTVLAYERPDFQAQARALVPIEKIWAAARSSLREKAERRRTERNDRRHGRVVIDVGPSANNAKIVPLPPRPKNRSARSLVEVSASPRNAQDPSWSDRFSVELQHHARGGGAIAASSNVGSGIDEQVVVVRRTDSPHEGWGQHLQLVASWSEPPPTAGDVAEATKTPSTMQFSTTNISALMRELVARYQAEGDNISMAAARAIKAIARIKRDGYGRSQAASPDDVEDVDSGDDADEAIASGSWDDSDASRELFLVHLLRWFKHDFFRWCNAPPCDRCGAGNCEAMGGGVATPEESRWGARRVEVYKCTGCGNNNVRFPRYNHPGKLLETRRGRCGEWANAFTLVCRALGFEARYVLDWTDHVWTEVWSPTKGRWLHADSCEAALDRPLCYEAGWGKNLTYVIAFSRFGCADVTRRYSQHWPATLARRREVPESWLKERVALLEQEGRERAGALGLEKQATLQEAADARDLATRGRPGGALRPEELQGRASGSLAWRQARAEV